MDSKRISIKDVADLAGVSVSAVSRYLNDGYISSEKKEAIANAISTTGYKPSKQAQMLRTRKTNKIGVIVPRISSESVARLLDGISSEITQTNYELLFASTSNNADKEIEYIKLFENNPVDGIILIGTFYTKAHKNLLKKSSIPIVVTGQNFEECPCVYHNDYGAATAMTQKLINSGCKNIMYIGITQNDIATGKDRFDGFKDTLTKNNITLNLDLVREAEFSIESGYQVTKNILSSAKRIDGIFCATDNIAISAIKAIKERGLRIPNDIQVTGIGHNRISSIITPSLTTTHLFYRECGMEAVRMLLRIINGNNITNQHIQLEYEIIQGNTTIA